MKNRREGRETGREGKGMEGGKRDRGGKERGGKGRTEEGIEEEKWTLPDVQSQSSSYEPEPNAGKSMIMDSEYGQSLVYTGVQITK